MEALLNCFFISVVRNNLALLLGSTKVSCEVSLCFFKTVVDTFERNDCIKQIYKKAHKKNHHC